ncbi:isochorismatase family protein [Methylocella sp. CPCC 101449]|uniref:cysteine hydrolase family protein n=1 Tax=Methylocella sp. CPCC 101449 TaxID=2987531 RepID=UPI00288D4303|nr:isochorismatase family protein [Methylocella sp. CPCC 101449]MDT2023661.1 isochorismatase family protein [Methylocella sp. CPCC 101449]
MKEWMKIVPAEERKAYESGGFMGSQEIGKRTALIVVDVTYGFTGSPGLTLQEAIKEFGPACGPASWEAMPRIAQLIAMFRDLGRPVVYTRGHAYDTQFSGHATKSKRALKYDGKFSEFPPDIAPRDGEWILDKTKASAFFQTPLAAYLVRQQIDSVMICGVSTSGCVRASVVDAFSNGFSTFVVDDCCFDRSNFAHCANLFDMNAKYATVVSLNELEVALLGKQMEPAKAN